MDGRETLGLFQLNQQIRQFLLQDFPDPVWVIAEISEMNLNRNGHCYLELIEKEPDGDRILARSRATIWSGTFKKLKPYFETTTGQELVPGLKVMVKVTVEFHELYSISLNIQDIEPSFTIGDLARKRMLILRKLEEAGTLEMNRELPLSPVPQRIAVISSPTAAGYGDFTDQLAKNPGQYVFYTKLFPAVMQGEETVPTILDALDRISRWIHFFDAVVIIRGGGSKLDLSSFDSFDLGLAVSQFPMPVITGIGHEQDDTIIDLVAHTRCKTPTATAEFLIDRVEQFDSHLDELAQDTIEMAGEMIDGQKRFLSQAVEGMGLRVKNFTGRQALVLQNMAGRSARSAANLLKFRDQDLTAYEQVARLHDPVKLLRRGYSITYKDGKPVKSVAGLQSGETIQTRLADGRVTSKVESTLKKTKDDAPTQGPVQTGRN